MLIRGIRRLRPGNAGPAAATATLPRLQPVVPRQFRLFTYSSPRANRDRDDTKRTLQELEDQREARKTRQQHASDDAAFRETFRFAVNETRDTEAPKTAAGGAESQPESPADSEGAKSQSKTRENAQQRFEDLKKSLPSYMHEAQPQMYKWFGEKMDQIQAGALTAGQTLNEVTGYKAIEKLKLSIEKLEEEVLDARAEVRGAKKAYSDAISERSNSQREVNELLQRKHNWSSGDLERFTELYRNDHANENDVHETKKRLGECEHHVEDLALQLSKQILTRYHEEQIWSDKIRRASTWGTWILMGFNVVLFIVVQLGLEPWKRRRLVGSFEDKVKESLIEWEARSEARRLEEATMAATATQAITDLQHKIQADHASKGDVVEAQAEISSIKANLASWFKEREDEEKQEIAKEAHELAVIAEDPEKTDVAHQQPVAQNVDTELVVSEPLQRHLADESHSRVDPTSDESSPESTESHKESSEPSVSPDSESFEQSQLPETSEHNKTHPLVYVPEPPSYDSYDSYDPNDPPSTHKYTSLPSETHPLVFKQPTKTPQTVLLQAIEAVKKTLLNAKNDTMTLLRSTYNTAVHRPYESSLLASLGGLFGGLITFIFLH